MGSLNVLNRQKATLDWKPVLYVYILVLSPKPSLWVFTVHPTCPQPEKKKTTTTSFVLVRTQNKNGNESSTSQGGFPENQAVGERGEWPQLSIPALLL